MPPTKAKAWSSNFNQSSNIVIINYLHTETLLLWKKIQQKSNLAYFRLLEYLFESNSDTNMCSHIAKLNSH